MISVINEKGNRVSLARNLIRISVEKSEGLYHAMGGETPRYSDLLTTEQARRHFYEYTNTKQGLDKAREAAIEIIVNETGYYKDKEVIFAKLFIMCYKSGADLRKFFIRNTMTSNAFQKIVFAASHKYNFKGSEEEELI